MPDNIELDAGTGGKKVAAASLSISGDTADVQMVTGGLLSGSEGSWVYSQFVGGAGAVAAGVQRITLASDDPAVAKLGTIDADTSALFDCVSGSELQVDVVASLPAGTNAIGKLAANTGVDIGDVDILSLPSDTFAADAQAYGKGVLVQGDDGTNRRAILVGTDGHVQVDVLACASHAVTNVGTFAVQVDGSALTALQLIDDVVYIDDADWSDGSSKHMLVGGLYQSSPQSITDGDVGPFQVDSNGRLLVKLASNTGVDVGDVDILSLPSGNLGAQAMAASLSITLATDDTHYGAVGAAADVDGVVHGQLRYIGEALGTIDADTSGLFGCVGGTELQVDVVASLPAGMNAIGKLAANTGVDIGDVDVTSVIPGVAATNLGKARASALGATDTGVAALAVRNDDLADLAGADGDYTPLQVNAEGALHVCATKAEDKQVSGVAAGGAPGSDNMIAAVGGKKLLVTAMTLIPTSATTNVVYVVNDDNNLFGNNGNGVSLSIDADGDTLGGIVLPYNPAGWFKTDTVNEPVTLKTSAAQDIIFALSYIETD